MFHLSLQLSVLHTLGTQEARKAPAGPRGVWEWPMKACVLCPTEAGPWAGVGAGGGQTQVMARCLIPRSFHLCERGSQFRPPGSHEDCERRHGKM